MTADHPKAKMLEELVILAEKGRKISQAERWFLKDMRESVESDAEHSWERSFSYDCPHHVFCKEAIPKIDTLLKQ